MIAPAPPHVDVTTHAVRQYLDCVRGTAFHPTALLRDLPADRRDSFRRGDAVTVVRHSENRLSVAPVHTHPTHHTNE